MCERVHVDTVGIGEIADGWKLDMRKAEDMEKRLRKSSGGAWCWLP